MLAYYLEMAWKRKGGRAAAGTLGAGDGQQVYAAEYQRAARGGELKAQLITLERAFVTQAVWSNQRLHDLGYEVEVGCILCGGAEDSLHHRLFACACTQDLRSEHFSSEELQWLGCSPSRSFLLQGMQLLPYLPETRPPSLGHDTFGSWTLTGAPILPQT